MDWVEWRSGISYQLAQLSAENTGSRNWLFLPYQSKWHYLGV